MRSRWFHAPVLRVFKTDKSSSWLEIFYDLVFVTSFVQLSSQTAKAMQTSGQGVTSLVLFGVAFSALWFSWTGFTFFSNRYDVDDFLHRVLIFLQMLAVIGVSTSASEVLGEHVASFSVCFGFAQLIIAGLYLRGYLQTAHAGPFCGYWSKIFGSGALIWFIAAFVPSPWIYLFWFSGATLLVAGTFAKQARRELEEAKVDRTRLARRYGFLTLIVLGEMFMQVMISTDASSVASSLASSLPSSGAGAFSERLPMLACALLVTFSIWWIYFDDVASSRLRPRKFFFNYWLFAHLPLHGAIFAAGVALLRLMTLDTHAASDLTRWLLSISVSVIFVVLAFLDWVTDREQAKLNGKVRITLRLLGATVALLLASIGQGLSSGMFLSFIALTCFTQVVLDLFVAPYHAVLPGAAGAEKELSELAHKAAADPLDRPPRVLVGEAIRKNTPREFQNDLYSYFIESSWPRFLIFIVVGYLLINLIFAGIFLLEPGGISNARPDSFADAFYFSVQTFSTIGYGTLSPIKDFTNIIVVIEAGVGLAGVALVTGLMFTKASKPRPGILFSTPVIITKMNGTPHLMFRAGNTRGNEVVSAEISVSYLRDEISLEGHHVRRMHDLRLVRARSPFFSLSWLVLHEIDERSPFFGLKTSAEIGQRVLSLSCVLTGHDSTYGQTVYSRHVYYPEDFRVNARFVDVTSQLPDGRLVIDYGKFHDTAPV